MLDLWLGAAAAVFGAVTLLWLVSLVLRDAAIVDSFWSLGFVLCVWIYAGGPAADPWSPDPRWVHALAVTLWGLRLSLHIARRHMKAGGEDYRYAEMRRKAGPSFKWRSLVTVFWLQGALILVIGLPLLFTQAGERADTWLATDLLFLILFTVGLFFETVADWQLSRFKAEPSNRGRVLDSGLWRYSRHPNYFGDAVVWWAFGVSALGSAGGVYTLVCSLLMTFLLLKVSGVSLLEKTIVDRRPAYASYIARTSAFFPWFPKSTGGRDSAEEAA